MVFCFEKSATKTPDTVNIETLLPTPVRPKAEVIDVLISPPINMSELASAAKTESYFDMFAHLSFEELQQVCKYYIIILQNKYIIKMISHSFVLCYLKVIMFILLTSTILLTAKALQ